MSSATPLEPRPAPSRGRRHRARAWVPALRLARRTAWRYKSRTVLVAALIALPVFAMSMLSLVIRTSALTSDERADRYLGSSDAYVEVTDVSEILPPDPEYFDSGGWSYTGEPEPRDASSVDIAALLPAGTELLSAPVQSGVTASAGGRLASVPINGGGLAAPLGGHRHLLETGVAPADADEIAVTEHLAHRLRLDVGDTIALTGGTPAGSAPQTITTRVVGIAVDAACLSCDTIYTSADAATSLQTAEELEFGASRAYVRLPPGTDTVALWRDLAAVGVSFMPRDAIMNPDRYPVDSQDFGGASVDAFAAFGLVVGFGLLEVVLLAGTAFAVGARRQVRELGLVAANGGERRDVRRVVVAQGVVLGVVGGVAGVALGFLPLLVLWSTWESYAGHLFGSVVIRPLELAGIAGFGLLAGLLAAVIPARTASKVPVMTALADRFVTPTRPLRRPLLGLGLVLVGAGVAFGCAARARILEAAYDDRVAALGFDPDGFTPDSLAPPPDTRAYILAAVAGLGVMAVGMLVGSPALVAGLARVARFLPLVPRLALRDSGRHRHRTAPAICAVAIAVTGSVALGIVITADDAQTEAAYVPYLPLGAAEVWGAGDPTAGAAQLAQQATALDAAADLLGSDTRVDRQVAYIEGSADDSLGVVTSTGVALDQVFVADLDCVSVGLRGPVGEEPAPSGEMVCPNLVAGDVAVGGADLIAFFTGEPVEPDVAASLARGEAVLLRGDAQVVDGHVSVGTYSSLLAAASPAGGEDAAPEGGVAFEASLLAVQVAELEEWAAPAAVISPETAASLGLVTEPASVLLSGVTTPTEDQVDLANGVLADALMGVTVERGYQSDVTIILLVLGGASGLVTVASVAIAVGLAAAESKADLATLAAVGADPRRRRILAMWQAAVVGLVGCLLGVAFGSYVAAVALEGFGLAPWLVPWSLVATIGLAVPLLAVVVAGVFTRSRLPLARRLTA